MLGVFVKCFILKSYFKKIVLMDVVLNHL